MEEQVNPILKKPPGYRDPEAKPNGVTKPPVRKLVLPQSFPRKEKKRNRCCRSCCCFICILIIILILFIAVAGCIFYLWFEPRFPVFHLQSLNFPRFNITSGSDGPALDSKALIRIEVRNPNPVLKLKYDKLSVSLKTESSDLGSAKSPGFVQGKKNTTVLKFKMEVNDLLISGGVANKLKSRFKAKSLTVKLVVSTGFGVGGNGWSTVKVPVKVICEGMSLRNVQGGTVPKCKINIFKGIFI